MYYMHTVFSVVVSTSKLIFALGREMSYSSLMASTTCRTEAVSITWMGFKKLAKEKIVASRANDEEIIHWCICYLST
jgi:hypothetical protein